MVRDGGTRDCGGIIVAAGVHRLSRACARIDVVSLVSFHHHLGSTDHVVCMYEIQANEWLH